MQRLICQLTDNSPNLANCATLKMDRVRFLCEELTATSLCLFFYQNALFTYHGTKFESLFALFNPSFEVLHTMHQDATRYWHNFFSWNDSDRIFWSYERNKSYTGYVGPFWWVLTKKLKSQFSSLFWRKPHQGQPVLIWRRNWLL